jgi:hypothetical protein
MASVADRAAAGSADTDPGFSGFLERYRTDVLECLMTACRIAERPELVERLGPGPLRGPEHPWAIRWVVNELNCPRSRRRG